MLVGSVLIETHIDPKTNECKILCLENASVKYSHEYLTKVSRCDFENIMMINQRVFMLQKLFLSFLTEFTNTLFKYRIFSRKHWNVMEF